MAATFRLYGSRFDRDQSVSPGSQLPVPSPMPSPNASQTMMPLGDHRRELSVLQSPSYMRNNSVSPVGASNGYTTSSAAITPISAMSGNSSSHGFLNSNIFDESYRPGTSGLNGSISGTTIGPDSYFPADDRRPSVASLITNASSTGSKQSIGRSIVRRLFGDDEKESPTSSELSLPQGGLQRPNAAYSRTNTGSGSRPSTPLPSSDVVPFLYQDILDISKYGEAPVRANPVPGARYDGSEDTPSTTSHRSHFGRKKDKTDKDKELPSRPHTKDTMINRDHRKELGRIDGGLSYSQNSSQTRLHDRPGSPTPSIASSLSTHVPKSPGQQPAKKSIFGRIRKGKGKGEEHEKSEVHIQPMKIKNAKTTPEPLVLSSSPHKYDAGQKRGSASGGSGVGSSVTAEYHNFIHPHYNPRTWDYAGVEQQPMRKNLNGGAPQAQDNKKKAMRRGYSHDTTRKFLGKARGDNDNLFPLDTDLQDMSGILAPTAEMTPPTGTFLSQEESHKAANQFSNLSATLPEPTWQVPDSWQYVGHHLGDEEFHGGQDYLDDAGGQTVERRASLQYCIRVFRADYTFATLSCSLNAPVAEVLRLLGRKSFLQDDIQNYQLVIKKGDFSRILQGNEKPLQIQKRLLEQAGYTEYDHLDEIGREDHSYLCRFTFRMSKVGGCSLNVSILNYSWQLSLTNSLYLSLGNRPSSPKIVEIQPY